MRMTLILTLVLLAGCGKGRMPSEAEFKKYAEENVSPPGRLIISEPLLENETTEEPPSLSFVVDWASPLFPENHIEVRASLTLPSKFKKNPKDDEVSISAYVARKNVAGPSLNFGKWEYRNGKLVSEDSGESNPQQWDYLKPRAEMLKEVITGAYYGKKK